MDARDEMSTAGSYPPVTEQLLGEVVRRILSVGAPRKIVLFGSRAAGRARSDSDLDVLLALGITGGSSCRRQVEP
jgi:predicted nucleotidyltransferase